MPEREANGQRAVSPTHGAAAMAAPLSGLDAWAAEVEAAVPRGDTAAAPPVLGGVSDDGNDDGNDDVAELGGASTSQLPGSQQQQGQGQGRGRGKKRKRCFRYGNYHRYYGYRVGESLEDHRIPHLRGEWFAGKRCVDIGCNEGLVSLSIAVQFHPASMLGIDIDTFLVGKAQEKLGRLRRAAARQAAQLEAEDEQARHRGGGEGEEDERRVPPSDSDDNRATEKKSDDGEPDEQNGKGAAAEEDDACKDDNNDGDEGAERGEGDGVGGRGGEPSSSRPTALADAGAALGSVSFRAGNFLEEYFPPHSVDAYLCLSVTKWIQLNWGDAGLKKMFKTVYDSLSPGGVFIVEPQPWKSYRQAFRKQKMPEETRENFKAIELKPTQYGEYLRSEVGFRLVETLRSADMHSADEFDRTVLCCVK